MAVLMIGIIISYLVGSIPTAYIFGHMLKSIDIRKYGSGNVGATNVFRVFGKWAGITVLLLDIYKGFWIIAIVCEVLGLVFIWERIIMAVAVVLGHNYTVFLKFKGGKGVATSLGVLIGLTVTIAAIRPVLFLTLFTFLCCFLVSRIISLSSIIAAMSLPIYMLITRQVPEILLLGVFFCVFVVYRHIPNIKRLKAGQEPKVQIFSNSDESI